MKTADLTIPVLSYLRRVGARRAASVAAALDISRAKAERVLAELVDADLLTSYPVDGFGLRYRVVAEG